MNREEMQAELAAINIELHRYARGGVARTKQTETELTRLQTRQRQLEQELSTAPSAAAMNPHQREIARLESELRAIDHQLDLMAGHAAPLTLSGQLEEGTRVRTYADQKQRLNARLATLKAAEAAAAAQVPSLQPAAMRTQPLLPSAFVQVPNGNVGQVASVTAILEELGGHGGEQSGSPQNVRELTTEAAVRAGVYGASRPQIFQRIGVSVPDTRSPAVAARLPAGRTGMGNGLDSAAVQGLVAAKRAAGKIARGKTA